MQCVNSMGMGRIKPRFDVEIVLKNFQPILVLLRGLMNPFLPYPPRPPCPRSPPLCLPHFPVLLTDGWLDTKSRLWTPKSRLCPTFVQCLSIVCPKSTKIQGLSRLWTPKSKVCLDSGHKVQDLSRLWTPTSKVCPGSGLPSPTPYIWTGSGHRSTNSVQTLDLHLQDLSRFCPGRTEYGHTLDLDKHWTKVGLG